MSSQAQEITHAHRGVIRNIRAAYWLALGLMAILVTATYLLMDDIMRANRAVAEIQYLASQQQTIARQIGAIAMRDSLASERKQLPGLIGEFESNLAQLQTASRNDSSVEPFQSDPAQFLRAATHADAGDIREQTLPFLQAAHAAIESNSPIEQGLIDGTVESWDALARRMAEKSAADTSKTVLLHGFLFVATLFLLLLEALLIFRPLTVKVAERTDELVTARNSMAYLAAHDGLTGLRNRAFLTDHFETLIETTRRRRDRIAVVHLDLDHFKDINDTFGHAAGDFVLCEIAKRLRISVRASDICARLGGDEFVIVLTAIATTSDIADVTSRILNEVNRPLMYEGNTVMAGASAGIAVFPEDASSPEELLVHADLALYRAKEDGRGRARFFSDDLRREHENRKALEADLRDAIGNAAFTVNYQPQISLQTSKVVGVEALVRWSTPQRGAISPGEFIPTAEKAGLMDAIGRIIIRKAIHQAAEWHHAGIDFGRLAINASPSELQQDSFVDFLLREVSEAGLPREKLSVEIVESVMLDEDRHGVYDRLRRLRAAGIHLELDDFGTGYASLAHVNANEIDRLKIDRRFVHNINNDADNAKIVRAIVELGRGLGISIVAEGAETVEELDLLRSIGCMDAQGFGIAFPMPADEATDWLALHSVRTAKVLRMEKRTG